MWQRPDQYLDPDPDATVEFPAVTDDEPPGWRVHGGQSADGWVSIEFIPLTEAELSGEQAPDESREVPRPRTGGEPGRARKSTRDGEPGTTDDVPGLLASPGLRRATTAKPTPGT